MSKKDKKIWCLDCDYCREEVISEAKSICNFTCIHPKWENKEVDINEYILLMFLDIKGKPSFESFGELWITKL